MPLQGHEIVLDLAILRHHPPSLRIRDTMPRSDLAAAASRCPCGTPFQSSPQVVAASAPAMRCSRLTSPLLCAVGDLLHVLHGHLQRSLPPHARPGISCSARSSPCPALTAPTEQDEGMCVYHLNFIPEARPEIFGSRDIRWCVIERRWALHFARDVG